MGVGKQVAAKCTKVCLAKKISHRRTYLHSVASCNVSAQPRAGAV